MSLGCSEELVETKPYKPGSIKSIRLVNFMCHESFELPLGPNVNFIIGPNGSGKSALLTAITVALGGRATITSRARRMSEFIKIGTKSAKITVVLHNYETVMEIDNAFKPHDYGKFIIIEKHIFQDEARLTLKNDRGKKISERKQELDEMLDHFNILINNPICILNQEVSKCFLNSKKPEDKFELFMKATNLEQIEQDYEAAKQSYQEWGSCISKKNAAFSLLDKEYRECQEKTKFIMNRLELDAQAQSLRTEKMFAIRREHEKAIKDLDEKLSKIAECIKAANESIENRAEKIKNYECDIQVHQAKVEAVEKRIEEAKKKFNDFRQKEGKVKIELIERRNKLDSQKRKIAKLQRDAESLIKDIEAKEKEAKESNNYDNEADTRKLETARLEEELPIDRAREKSIRNDTHQLSESMQSIRSDLHSASLRISDLVNKDRSARGRIERMKSGQQNSLARYGEHTIKIIHEINIAFEKGRFKHKPIGPLGSFLKLKNPDVAGPLEIHLGRNAHAFACDNNHDMAVLTSIYKKLSREMRDFKQPMTIRRAFNQKHDVSRYRAEHDTFKTLLDHIEIENPVVYNVLVDRCFLESVLYIPDYEVAESIMVNEFTVPRNTRMAYTSDCSVMHPRTQRSGYKSFANKNRQLSLFSNDNSELIRQLEKERQILEAEIRDAENHHKTIQEQYKVQRAEYERNRVESEKLLSDIRKKEEQLLNLKTMVSIQPEDLSALKDEQIEIKKQIDMEKLRAENLKESLETIEKELSEVTKDKNGCSEMLRMHEERRKTDLEIIERTRASINDFGALNQQARIKIDSLTAEKNEQMTKYDEVQRMLATSSSAIPEDAEEPATYRSSDKVQAELDKLMNLIKIHEEENTDPEEAMEKLEKRMVEINSLVTLKESNNRNFNKAAKSIKQRTEGFALLRRHTVASVSSTFSSVMRTMQMNGMLKIYLNDLVESGEVVRKARTLEIKVETNFTPSQRINLLGNESSQNIGERDESARRTSRTQPSGMQAPRAKRPRMDREALTQSSAEKENEVKMSDTRSLSGGERSFSTVAFVLALWHHCSSPFKLMDEIDVFMDMVTRRISYNALIRFAQLTEDSGQFLFFSPLELPKIDDAAKYVRVFEMPTIVRRGEKRAHVANEVGDEGE